MFISLTKLALDGVSPLGGNNQQESTLGAIAAPGALAGLGLTGGSIAAWLAHEKSKKNKQ
jgi:hypothetical protein